MAKWIDKQGMLGIDGMQFPVVVKDVKQAYGNLRCLVTPVGGGGSTWVDASRLGIGEEA
jgi:hypothetical protein